MCMLHNKCLTYEEQILNIVQFQCFPEASLKDRRELFQVAQEIFKGASIL